MSIHGCFHGVVNVAGPPGSIGARSIDKSDGELIQVFQHAGDRLTGREGHRDFGARVLWIKHLLFEFKALVPRCNPGKVPGGRVAGGASARALEVLLARFDISGLEICGIYSLAPAASSGSAGGKSIVLLRV